VEEDDDMRATRSSRTERGRGKPPPRGSGDDPFTMDDLEEEERDHKPRRLEGIHPRPYDGKREETAMFLASFKRFMRMNAKADIARDPFMKCAYFLGLMEGPDTAGWVLKQDRWLDEIEDDPTKLPRGATPWRIMERDFERMFVDYAKNERATKALGELKMEKGNVDHYIARFQQLASEGEHDVDQPTILTMFANGLPTALADKCYDLNPHDFDEWALAAQRCHAIWLKKQYAKGNLTSTQPSNPWKNLRWGNQGQKGRGGKGTPPTRFTPRDPNAMDTSATVRKATTEAEKQKCRQEGRCYECNKQGHVVRDCPDRKSRARTTKVEDAGDKVATSKAASFDDGETLADYALKLSEENRDAFIKKIMGSYQEDFQEV
jgi:hypothetical protein